MVRRRGADPGVFRICTSAIAAVTGRGRGTVERDLAAARVPNGTPVPPVTDLIIGSELAELNAPALAAASQRPRGGLFVHRYLHLGSRCRRPAR